MKMPKVMIVDDNKLNLLLMSKLTESVTGAQALVYDDPVAGYDACAIEQPDLILVDFMMPDLNGHDFIRLVRQLPECADVPIVMVTTESEKSVRQEALEAGATEFLLKPIDVPEYRLRLRNLLALRRAHNILKDQAAVLKEEVREATASIMEREKELIVRLSRAAEHRDPETGAHVIRMAHYARLIAKQLQSSEQYQQLILDAAPMHDIGKLGIPDAILLKAGQLDEEEMRIMRKHPRIGARILSGSSAPVIRLAEEIAMTHHEKFDGTGYPQGLKGEGIPLSGRIVAVADVFDALTSERPYKEAWPKEQARAYIAERAGTHFCPQCVQALLGAWEDILEVRHRFADIPEPQAATPATCEAPASIKLCA
jgi:putative two-component system response regulator